MKFGQSHLSLFSIQSFLTSEPFDIYSNWVVEGQKIPKPMMGDCTASAFIDR